MYCNCNDFTTKSIPFAGPSNCIGDHPTYPLSTPLLIDSMNLFNVHFNVNCINIHEVIYMNTGNFTAKHAQQLPRIAVASPVMGEIWRMGYHIEAKGISDSKSRLNFP